MPRPMMKWVFALALVVACGGSRGHQTTPTAPRLVVLMVIDQWPEWSFEAKRSAFQAGFVRLVTEGEWYVGRYPTASTLTGPGHALLGTGETSSRSGIVANEWWDRDSSAVVRAVNGEDGAVTAKWLRVPGLADRMAAARSGGKAVSVSLKARSAILPLGRAGTPIWYDSKTGAWATVGAPPPWLAAFTQGHSVAARARQVWQPLDAAEVAALSGVADDQPGELGIHGLGPTFPHDLAQTGERANEAITAMPLGDELVFDTALAAIRGEQLGSDQTPDLLVISLSAHDVIGHAWGHESREMWDEELRLDQQLGKFLDELDNMVGVGAWSLIATSDHGGSPLPEHGGGGRIVNETVREAANNAAAAVLGPGRWIDYAGYPNIYFSKAMLAKPQRELASAVQRVESALRSFPGIQDVGRVADVSGPCDSRSAKQRALCLTFDPERSGDLYFLPKPGWITHSAATPLATSHGSLHDYDQLVPLIVLSSDRKRHPPQSRPGAMVEMTRVAAMVRAQLGVP